MADPGKVKCYPTFRVAIDSFLNDRLHAKLAKLALDDPARQALTVEYQRGSWLESAAKRVKQIQAATHTIKATHPDARGTNFYVSPSELRVHDELGSHALGNDFAMDVVGNAAALDVYKLLKLEVSGRSLLQALDASDPDALQALSDNTEQARALCNAFIGLISRSDVAASSHGRAKQVYWLVGDDATDDSQYHLLAPLFATSLAQAVHDEVQDARFGERNKMARQARREGAHHAGVYREYRGLAVRKMGGTKPQNISQLNSDRGGINYLFASLPPPDWRGGQKYLPVNAASIFIRAFNARPAVRSTLYNLKMSLKSHASANRKTRERIRELVDEFSNELTLYAEELLHLPAGWTRESTFENLEDEEKLWLDPLRAELPGEEAFSSRWQFMDWPDQIGGRFGRWLNDQLIDALPEVGYSESVEWRRLLLRESSKWTQHLRAMRGPLDGPGNIPFRKTHDELIAVKEAE